MNSLPAMTLPISSSSPLDSLSAKVHHLTHLVNAVTNLLSATLSIVSLLHQLSPHAGSSHILETRLDLYHNAFLFSRKSLATLADWVGVQVLQVPADADRLSSEEAGDAMIEEAVVSLRAAAEACEALPELIETLDEAQGLLDLPWRGVEWDGWPFVEAWDGLQELCDKLVVLRESGVGEDGVGWRRAWSHLVDA